MRWAGRGSLTKQEHLDLVTLQHLVTLQLIFDLLISLLPLLLLCAHSTTHFDVVALFVLILVLVGGVE